MTIGRSSWQQGKKYLAMEEVVDNYFFHCSWSTTSCKFLTIAGGQVLLPLQVVNCFFHCSWSSISSSLHVVKYFFLCRWSSYFFHHSWSNTTIILDWSWSVTSSIAGDKLLLPMCRWSTTSSTLQLVLLQLLDQLLLFLTSCTHVPAASALILVVFLQWEESSWPPWWQVY